VDPTADAFAAAVTDVLENKERRQEKIRNAMAAVSENTSEISANRLLDTYERLFEMYQAKRERFVGKAGSARFDFVELVKIALIVIITCALQRFEKLPDPAAYFDLF